MRRITGDKSGGTFLAFIVLLAFISIVAWAVGTHTIIRTDREVFWIEKPFFGLDRIYVDTRGWDVMDYLSEPAIAKALVARGYKTGHKQKDPFFVKPEDVGGRVENALEKARDKIGEITEHIGQKIKTD
ncbi:MAG: hypothetical protein U9P80_01785 [Thermodesulfobacteriota bacterium]|nr:hypothetical protein [Thermodesulfobacteriota bacterium]